ncbi:DUF305 domain-containing protein [Hymenobacter sp.]|uniref:DUF305 domain-containing protein n=1 Tax=Hymenobacter sp. TaxID=1898978 RepID=UPI00286C9116|nr:DUF305 domain-containing protein [Hymenobacter sp.]
MKTSAFFLAALCSGTMLLASCDGNKTTETTTTSPVAPADSSATGGDMAGMDHSAMSSPAGASPLVAAMNDMMGKMSTEKPKGNTDHDFAHMILAHHQGAVAMADIQLRDGKDAAMRQLAEQIKADQQREIGQLEAAATRLDNAPTNYKPTDPADPFTSKMKASMDGMMKMPATVADPDMNFNMLMTVHHQSAVDMAQAELAHGKDTKLKAMAQLMITAQQKEIEQLKAWHAKNGDKMKAMAALYECPMKCAGSASAKPGACPTCGMALEKKS